MPGTGDESVGTNSLMREDRGVMEHLLNSFHFLKMKSMRKEYK